MNYANQVIKSFKSSTIERILIVDDAYDAPVLDSRYAGVLLEYLTEENLRERIDKEQLSENNLNSAIDALNGGNYEDESISKVVSALYEKYLRKQEPINDLNGFFNTVKGSSLDSLKPLHSLLDQCVSMQNIKMVGTGGNEVEIFSQFEPDLIFMDFFLSPLEISMDSVTESEKSAHRYQSVNILKNMLAEKSHQTPAVILMSSADITTESNTYVSRLDGRMMALRFGILNKAWISFLNNNLNVADDAADVLMDTSGSFEFGLNLETALKTWDKGVNAALDKIHSELHQFDVKDFAYLQRFRLYDERETFANYLEWFLGEYFRAAIDDMVDWNSSAYSRLNETKLTEAIEGAHPRPSNRIAAYFHNIRFNSRETRPRDRIAFGDLFIEQHKENVRLVISPDCDLVSRNGNPSAVRFLTVGGKIKGLDEEHVSANNLIVIDDSLKSIKWEKKDLMTHEFEDDISALSVEGSHYGFFASVRLIYALSIQQELHSDLSRIGMPVPPIVHHNAPAKVYIKKKSGNRLKVEIVENSLRGARVQVLMPRGGNEVKKRALFLQSFVRDLITYIENIEDTDLHDDHLTSKNELIQNQSELRTKMLHEGLELPSEEFFKLSIAGNKKRKSWLEIEIDLSDESQVTVLGEDPLDPDN